MPLENPLGAYGFVGLVVEKPIVFSPGQRTALIALAARLGNELSWRAVHQRTTEELDRLGLTDPDLHLAVFATLDGLVFQQVTMEDSDRMERALRALRTLLATAQR